MTDLFQSCSTAVSDLSTCGIIGAEPGGPVGRKLCEETAAGSSEAAGAAGGGEEGGGGTTGAGREEKRGARKKGWVEVELKKTKE